MMSRCSQSAPAFSTSRMCAWRRPQSAASTDGAMITDMCAHKSRHATRWQAAAPGRLAAEGTAGSPRAAEFVREHDANQELSNRTDAVRAAEGSRSRQKGGDFV